MSDAGAHPGQDSWTTSAHSVAVATEKEKEQEQEKDLLLQSAGTGASSHTKLDKQTNTIKVTSFQHSPGCSTAAAVVVTAATWLHECKDRTRQMTTRSRNSCKNEATTRQQRGNGAFALLSGMIAHALAALSTGSPLATHRLSETCCGMRRTAACLSSKVCQQSVDNRGTLPAPVDLLHC